MALGSKDYNLPCIIILQILLGLMFFKRRRCERQYVKRTKGRKSAHIESPARAGKDIEEPITLNSTRRR